MNRHLTYIIRLSWKRDFTILESLRCGLHLVTTNCCCALPSWLMISAWGLQICVCCLLVHILQIKVNYARLLPVGNQPQLIYFIPCNPWTVNCGSFIENFNSFTLYPPTFDCHLYTTKWTHLPCSLQPLDCWLRLCTADHNTSSPFPTPLNWCPLRLIYMGPVLSYFPVLFYRLCRLSENIFICVLLKMHKFSGFVYFIPYGHPLAGDHAPNTNHRGCSDGRFR